MNNKTRNIIRQHIINNEERLPHPYLDIKGKLTIGIGFHIETEKEFLSLSLINEKTGKLATDAEKRAEFANMKKIREAQEKELVQGKTQVQGKKSKKFNYLASFYKGKTTLRMPEAEQDKLLDLEISNRVDKIKEDIGTDAWGKLTDGQKAVTVDIHYANGSLDEFTKFKEALKAGDAEAIARESAFYADKAAKVRDMGRLARNRAAITGEDFGTAEKKLKEQLKSQKKKPAETSDISSGEPGEKKITGGQGEDNLSPERQKLAADFTKDDGPMAEIALKDGAELTGPELRQVMETRNRLPDGPEKDRLHKLEEDHFSKVYGDDPVEVDDTGRAIEPQAKRAAPEKPLPAKATSGETLGDAMARLGSTVAANKGNTAGAAVTQALQTGLNMILQKAGDRKNEAAPQKNKKTALFNTLKVDGQVGPKTRHAARSVLAKMQPGTAEEALALGQFKKIAERGRRKELDPDKLRQSTSEIFGPLYRGPENSAPKASHEGVGLQMALNEIGKAQIKPLREDGVIGPKTAGAFGQVMKKTDPDDFISRLGDTFGFFC